MSQYRTGTVSTTNASQTVTGTGTLWLANVSAGDLFTVVGSGVTYQVAAVVSNTELTLNANYAGSTASTQSYVIARDFTPTWNLPIINKGDIETATLLKRAFQIIDSKL